MAGKAIVVLAEGFEEIEAVTPVDILRRAGVDVALVGLDSLDVTGAHGIVVRADRLLGDTEDDEEKAIILPGGLPGAVNLAASEKLGRILQAQAHAGRIVAAICASPAYVLAPLGILDGRRATCYPGCEERFGPTTTLVEKSVVVDGNILTSRGPGTAFAFGIALARVLADYETADEVEQAMLHHH